MRALCNFILVIVSWEYYISIALCCIKKTNCINSSFDILMFVTAPYCVTGGYIEFRPLIYVHNSHTHTHILYMYV